MKNIMKQKYVPCQLDVVKFKVERGYATSNGLDGQRVTNQQANQVINSWVATGTNANRNQAYVNEIWAWNDANTPIQQ